jgi:hypothetical protein
MDKRDEQLDRIEQRLDALQRTSERTYKLFLWTLIITVVVIVLPMIGMIFLVPKIISGYMGAFSF